MTKRRELEEHRHSLAEVREIMNSMKTLAFMESRKLDRFLAAQRTVVTDIETVAADFLSFHPDALPAPKTDQAEVYLVIGSERGFCGDFNAALTDQAEVYLVIGSERGFCGDFNAALGRFVAEQVSPESKPDAHLIVCGRKLQPLLEHDARVVHYTEGASVVEEIAAVLGQITDTLTGLQSDHGAPSLYLVFHESEESGIIRQRLLPPFRELAQPESQPGFAPRLLLEPAEFVLQLTEQYVFAALHAALYQSLMIENRRRVRHLEGAVSHLDEETAELTRRSNSLRQEEIVEEIEVILLSRDSLAAP
ncbi:MAG: F0F1 ATP synthase subunit gamma, partial [Acidiferrobacteraceae bacterium]